MPNKRMGYISRLGFPRSSRSDEDADPEYIEQVKRELAEAEEEARRGEGISLEEFERDAAALRDEIRAGVKAGRFKP